jgi:hypothetical protein
MAGLDPAIRSDTSLRQMSGRVVGRDEWVAISERMVYVSEGVGELDQAKLPHLLELSTGPQQRSIGVSRKYAKPLLAFSPTSMAGDLGPRHIRHSQSPPQEYRIGYRTTVIAAKPLLAHISHRGIPALGFGGS